MGRITILGTGYIGTSLGLALKAQKMNVEIVGHDRDYGRAGEAKKLGAVDRAEWNLPSSLEGAGMVVVATPLGEIPTVFEQIGQFLAPGCVVTDTASLKSPVLEWARERLPRHVGYVGGDPIVGLADPDRKPSATLFQDRTYCVIPSAEAPNTAVDQVIRLAQVVGASPLFLDPVEHDSHMAVVRQLPALVAATLMNLASANPSWRDGQRLAGPDFGAATALAAESPQESRAQLRANRETIVRWIQALQAELGEMARRIEDESSDELLKRLEDAQNLRLLWRPGVSPESQEQPPEIPTARQQFSTFFLGKFGDRKR